MARQGKMNFTGTTKNIIYYKLRDEYYMRQKPKKVNQTDATKKSASEFGKAARLAKECRLVFSELIPNAKDKAMQNRLTRLFYQWFRDQDSPSVPHFEFDLAYDLKSHLRIQPLLELSESRGVILKLPQFNPVKAIRNTQRFGEFRIVIGVAGISEDPNESHKEVIRRDVPYQDISRVEETILLGIKAPESGYLALAVSIVPLDKQNLNKACALISCVHISS